MIIPSSGIDAYTTAAQASRQQTEQLSARQKQQKDAEEGGAPTDKTNLSAEAIALSRKVQSAGPSQPDAVRQQPAPTMEPRNSGRSSLAINIRI